MHVITKKSPRRTRTALILGTGLCLSYAVAHADTTAQAPVSEPTAANVPTGDQLLLRLKPKVGQTYRTTMTMQMKTSQTLPNLRFEIDQTMVFVYDNSIKAVDADGNVRVQSTFRTVKHSIVPPTRPGEKKVMLTYDSTRPSSIKSSTVPLMKVMAKVWKAYLGSSISTLYSSTGKKITTEGMDAIFQNISKALTTDSSIPKAQMQGMLAELKKRYSDRAAEGLNQFWMIYPVNPVGIGDSWEETDSTFPFGSTAPVAMKTINTLVSRNKGRATVGVKSQFEFQDTKAQDAKQGLESITNYKGTQSSRYVTDESTGWPVSGEVNQRMTMHTQLVKTTRTFGNAVRETQMVPGYSKYIVSYKSYLVPSAGKK